MHPFYTSHLSLPFIGESGQLAVTAGSVLVIGAGGLGCPCLQALAGAGVGKIGVVDFDVVEESNLQRQVLFTHEDIGKKKADVAAAALRQRNPGIEVVSYHLYVNEENILDLLRQYDVIVDGTDNFEVRYLINDACVWLNKPWVYGAIHREEGQCAAFNVAGSGLLRDVFPEPATAEAIPSCAVIGAYNITTAWVGALMANEVLKYFLQLEQIATNKLITLQALHVTMRTLNYAADEKNRALSRRRFEQGAPSIQINYLRLQELQQQHPDLRLIDVRTWEERNLFSIGGEHLPLEDCTSGNSVFLPEQIHVFYCASGVRSMAAARWLKAKNFEQVYSLEGGIKKLQEELP